MHNQQSALCSASNANGFDGSAVSQAAPISIVELVKKWEVASQQLNASGALEGKTEAEIESYDDQYFDAKNAVLNGEVTSFEDAEAAMTFLELQCERSEKGRGFSQTYGDLHHGLVLKAERYLKAQTDLSQSLPVMARYIEGQGEYLVASRMRDFARGSQLEPPKSLSEKCAEFVRLNVVNRALSSRNWPHCETVDECKIGAHDAFREIVDLDGLAREIIAAPIENIDDAAAKLTALQVMIESEPVSISVHKAVREVTAFLLRKAA